MPSEVRLRVTVPLLDPAVMVARPTVTLELEPAAIDAGMEPAVAPEVETTASFSFSLKASLVALFEALTTSVTLVSVTRRLPRSTVVLSKEDAATR